MALEISPSEWVYADLFCDGLDEDRACAHGNDEPSVVSDIAPTPEQAAELVRGNAEQHGWVFDLGFRPN